MTILDKIMKPKSIAVVGASTKEHTIGSDIMKRLQEYNFNGKIYPVNPKGGIIEGLQAYTSVLEIPGEVDLAIIVVNAKFVLDTIDQCHEKGIKGLCIITAGFKETGAEGAEAEKQLLAKVREYGNGRIFAHIFTSAEPLYTKGGKHGEDGCRQYRGNSGKQSQSYSSERGVSDPSTDKHQSAGNNIGADYPAGNACQQAPQQGVLKECIL